MILTKYFVTKEGGSVSIFFLVQRIYQFLSFQLPRCRTKVAYNVPRPCAVADYGTLICPAKIKINAKRNAEFKDDNGNGARPLL